MNFTRDGGDYVIAGSAAGRPTDPAWIHNVQANPEVSVEADGRKFQATAKVEEGPEHDRLWDQHVAALPQFADCPEQSGRVIPMVRLTPKRADPTGTGRVPRYTALLADTSARRVPGPPAA